MGTVRPGPFCSNVDTPGEKLESVGVVDSCDGLSIMCQGCGVLLAERNH